eukprot:scaffold75164_cov33-Tisochrysis_lutea.AAC.4
MKEELIASWESRASERDSASGMTQESSTTRRAAIVLDCYLERLRPRPAHLAAADHGGESKAPRM